LKWWLVALRRKQVTQNSRRLRHTNAAFPDASPRPDGQAVTPGFAIVTRSESSATSVPDETTKVNRRLTVPVIQEYRKSNAA